MLWFGRLQEKTGLLQTLEEEARRCQWLVLWLDCDREGENIAYEVVDVCHTTNPRLNIWRAHFSALIERSGIIDLFCVPWFLFWKGFPVHCCFFRALRCFCSCIQVYDKPIVHVLHWPHFFWNSFAGIYTMLHSILVGQTKCMLMLLMPARYYWKRPENIVVSS